MEFEKDQLIESLKKDRVSGGIVESEEDSLRNVIGNVVIGICIFGMLLFFCFLLFILFLGWGLSGDEYICVDEKHDDYHLVVKKYMEDFNDPGFYMYTLVTLEKGNEIIYSNDFKIYDLDKNINSDNVHWYNDRVVVEIYNNYECIIYYDGLKTGYYRESNKHDDSDTINYSLSVMKTKEEIENPDLCSSQVSIVIMKEDKIIYNNEYKLYNIKDSELDDSVNLEGEIAHITLKEDFLFEINCTECEGILNEQ